MKEQSAIEMSLSYKYIAVAAEYFLCLSSENAACSFRFDSVPFSSQIPSFFLSLSTGAKGLETSSQPSEFCPETSRKSVDSRKEKSYFLWMTPQLRAAVKGQNCLALRGEEAGSAKRDGSTTGEIDHE